jgi:hypothetical protein
MPRSSCSIIRRIDRQAEARQSDAIIVAARGIERKVVKVLATSE